MNETTPRIYAPSLYWFAYQYHEGLVISTDAKTTQTTQTLPNFTPINPQWVKSQYEQIFTAFDIQLLPFAQINLTDILICWKTPIRKPMPKLADDTNILIPALVPAMKS